ncbi:hypothetical protein JTE90_025990 [Oedothorax gibbosus]|uniref:Uncharacterized protein n=1 Tax=Oedothorax gibbosus TaxID=931172 RepID=A0AAV6TSA4_9ARAC|nr:hypothetical protein JTE90_025990 [Oedothorax gibbosus]
MSQHLHKQLSFPKSQTTLVISPLPKNVLLIKALDMRDGTSLLNEPKRPTTIHWTSDSRIAVSAAQPNIWPR